MFSLFLQNRGQLNFGQGSPFLSGACVCLPLPLTCKMPKLIHYSLTTNW